MPKTVDDVLAELTARGLAGENPDAARSYTAQAAEAILSYCNLPEGIPLPAGLFYAWVEVSGKMTTGAAGDAAGAVSSISEGDTTIQFATPREAVSGALDGCKGVLNRYRRMAW